MLIDHIGYFFIPAQTSLYLVFRCLGRIAAPLFWFAFVEGYKHTSNKKKYFVRLAISALLMGLGNCLIGLFANKTISLTMPNMFLSLSLSIIIIELLQSLFKSKSVLEVFSKGMYVVGIGAMIGFFAEYGWFVLLIVPSLYFIQDKYMKCIMYCTWGFVISCLLSNPYQMYMLIAVIPFLLYTDEKPKKSAKWFFYYFYPAHIWILYLAHYLLF